MNKQTRFVALLGLLLSGVVATAQQNAAVGWSAFDGGFAEAATSNTMVRSVVGQSFAGPALAGNTQVTSGFLVDPRLRGSLVGVKAGGTLPLTFALSQNYPNPFNPSTVISYQLPVAGNVRLDVFDILGREVAVLVNERKAPGSYTVQFNASGFASGVYFYRIQAGSFVQTRKLMLLK